MTWRGKEDFAAAIKVKDLEMERLLWIMWVGPVLPVAPLKMKKEGRRRGQRDVMKKEAEEI